MSELRLETLTMPTADVGPVNPLPPLFATADLHAVVDPGEADAEMRHNVGYGRVRSVLPYLVQDGYGRDRRPAEHKVAVLENDVLRATFLLDLGGRLWSLVHKPTGRELLYRNPVFQPANLALRNAWFAGGVEWNIGTIGHSPTTCEPLHAARVLQPDGTPVLRMYEFERLREVVFQVDAWLPEGSPVLLVHVRIVNPNDVETPMYWWSNVAVPQADDVRVLAPADEAWQFAYDSPLRRVPIPVLDGQDRTYTTRAAEAADYFFAIADDQRRWVAALDGRGTGLVQTSTDRLRGRKLFLWGKSPGGDHWQEWLAQPGQEYLEIQAGLARTQLEHLPMPARASWSWVEAYGLLQSDAAAVHGDDWSHGTRRRVTRPGGADPPGRARRGADRRDRLGRCRPGRGAEPRVGVGSARTHGARAGRRRLAVPARHAVRRRDARARAGGLGRAAADRPDAVATGRAAAGLVPDEPTVAAAAGGGRRLAAQAAPRGGPRPRRGPAGGDRRLGRARSRTEPTAWAWRNLAVLAEADGDLALAVRRYHASVALRGDLAPLKRELVDALLAAGDGVQALAVIDAAPAEQRASAASGSPRSARRC